MYDKNFYSAIVVREGSGGGKVFHKYRRVKNTPAGLLSFQGNMQKLDKDRGRVIHINYYSRETRLFSHQFKP